MARRSWRVNIRGEEHTVEAKHNILTNAGEIRVNGKVVDSWGFRLWPPDRAFRVGRSIARFRARGFFPGAWELYVDGQLISSGGAVL